MIVSKLEKVLQFLKEQDIRIDYLIPDNLKCVMCSKIFVSCVESSCGCRFCSKCIGKLRKSGMLHCPGPSTGCPEELLSSVRIIHVDISVELSRIFINCPKSMCSSECSLENIKEHIQACGKQRVRCPFYKIGCNKRWVLRDNLANHLSWHSEIRNDLLLSSMGTGGKVTSGSEECVGNILIEINKIKKNLMKVDYLNQVLIYLFR